MLGTRKKTNIFTRTLKIPCRYKAFKHVIRKRENIGIFEHLFETITHVRKYPEARKHEHTEISEGRGWEAGRD